MIRRYDLAIATVCEIAASRQRLSQLQIAERLLKQQRRRTLEPTLQALVHAGILSATRGPDGGYELGRAAETITFDDVLCATDDDYSQPREIAVEDAIHVQIRAAMKERTIATALRKAA